MKKWTALICCVALLISQWNGISIDAYADDISLNEKANILNQIDLLAGDGKSFNLDQPLRRCDAAAFLVKAMGVNVTVLQNKAVYSKTKFKDVPSSAWYAPYVGYMTQMNIITGNGDGSFTPNEPISEKAFFSMLLKSMGYTTSDFTWNNINQFAYETGVVTDISYVFKEDDNTNYTRGHVANALYNALGKPMKGQSKNFVQLLIDGKVISADKAEQYGFIKKDHLATVINEIGVLSYSQIVATFNEAITIPTLDQIQVYEKFNPSVKLVPKEVKMSGNVVTIDLPAQTDKTVYTLEISKLADSLGNTVSSVKRDFVGYAATEVTTPYFKISKVEPINKKNVNIYFTHPVNQSAELELLYDIYLGETKFIEGNLKTISVKRSESNANMVTVSLKEAVFEAGREYQIKVKGDMASAYGVNLNKGDGESMAFVGSTAVVTLATLSQAYCQEGTYVYFSYSHTVDRTSAMKTTNYTIREVDTNKLFTVSQIYGLRTKEILDKSFVLKIEGVTPGKTYELIANNISDPYKTTTMAEMRISFVGSYANNQVLMLNNITPIDMTTISLNFNRELKDISVNANIVVDGSVSVVSKAIDPNDPSKLIVYLGAATPLQVGRIYGVTVYSGIVDYMDKKPLTNIGATVIGNGAVKPIMAIDSATFIGDSTIMLKFNQPISKTQSTQVSQYDIYYSDGKTEKLLIPGTAELVSDRVVILKMPYLLAAGTYRVQAKSIYDVSNQFRIALIGAEVK